eukprot:NODE_4336_length_1904_cov_7.539674.p1 GENE.NODE_4336_length_1904_cov_7.539674~~NODE_4336_length_1904_cov_7.539674.p1  ORF type:complete len:497 (-),score=131.22 NODE_4336_length_1904_cov_7.539674:412-1770(-)
MPGELSRKLSVRRPGVDATAQSWESSPCESSADASHLSALAFGAPSATEWLRQLEGTPEEDTLGDALAEELLERGARPAHSPVLDPHVHALVEALEKLRQRADEERRELGEAMEELAQQRAEVRAREEALEAELDAVRKQRASGEASGDYPPPSWLLSAEGTINIGVVGNSGVGKSLLINRLRKVKPGAAVWAPVGVNETTMEPTVYTFPTEQRVRLWDLPGAGTENFPAGEYIQGMGLRYFDKIVIVTAGRFTTTEVALRAELEKHQVPYFMVRTKIDIDVWNNMDDNSMNETATVTMIFEDFRQKFGVENPYLISLRDVGRYDFSRLTSDLFPALKRQLDAMAPAFCPGVLGWNDAWALPPVYSPALAGMQGYWRDTFQARYLVQGKEAHITVQDGRNAVITLGDSPECVTWANRWWVNLSSVSRSHGSLELRWAPFSLTDKPLVWTWAA